MLQEDPVLFQLYKDLVVSQVISAEEFWANRLNVNATESSSTSNHKQDVGISAAFLVCDPSRFLKGKNRGICVNDATSFVKFSIFFK